MALNEVSGEDVDVILELLESDYFKEELQLELDEIAEEVRVLSSKVFRRFATFFTGGTHCQCCFRIL